MAGPDSKIICCPPPRFDRQQLGGMVLRVTSLVDDSSDTTEEDQMFEIAARHVVDPATVTEEISLEEFLQQKRQLRVTLQSEFPFCNKIKMANPWINEYDPKVREALTLVPEGQWKEFLAFTGLRLETLTAWDKIALVGDASHPISGAFGSGAAFALEDG